MIKIFEEFNFRKKDKIISPISKYNPHPKEDPYGEEDWNDISESLSEDIIEDIKNFLVKDNDKQSWKDFVDSQRMGDCQLICYSIEKNFPGIKRIFGGIRLDIPCVDWDDGSENEEITHHWITINNKMYDFSKGTLNGYINFSKEEVYDPEVWDKSRYF
jgi:hypothetical protein